ncbi:hypothetical protein CYMTET_20103 [Cymbomonas tetramitiformis]|uniref:ADF-H domain-containing protein n=1 Tax=Cymbomonas tetramitiformis TaxID=36881 RepID=A0AAE0G4P9_9CHLO|nr:hypothetical protein CYMTET_20103 [Cymbomonas tetramitiformis]
MDSLQQTKAALDAGLLDAADFEAVKAAFVKAQQIKAGIEANLLSADDAQLSKDTFLKCIVSSEKNVVVSFNVNSEQDTPPETEVATTSAEAVEEPIASAPPPAAAPTAAPAPAPAAAVTPVQEPTPAPVKTEVIRSGSVSRSPTASRGSKFGRSVSGYAVSDDCVATYKQLVTKSAYSYLIFKLNEEAGTVIVGEQGQKGDTFGDFVEALPDGDPRYAVFDYAYTNDDGCKFNKILFIMWAPEGSPLKNKMLYASSKDYFKQHLDGVALEIQATDFDDLEPKLVRERVREVLTRK